VFKQTSTFTARLPNGQIVASVEELQDYGRLWVRDSGLHSRISLLCWMDVMLLERAFGIDPVHVVHAIRQAESGQPSAGTKPAAEFSRFPLKGLWHQHYFSPRFMAHNMFTELGVGGFDRIFQEVCDPAKSEFFTDEMAKELSHRVTVEQFWNRFEGRRLTGEWVIFARHNGKNHYLCCATHEEGDDAICKRIKDLCTVDFGDVVRAWNVGREAPLDNAASSN
jgi:hypothetical protein